MTCDRNEALTSGMLRLISAENDTGVSDSNKKGRSTQILVKKKKRIFNVVITSSLAKSFLYALFEKK